MEYNKIIAVTGLPGLYELLNSKTDGAIVRSLDDKSTKFVSSRIHNFSHLESIEIFTTRENVNLLTILKAMEESGEKLPDEKDGKGLKGYFEKVYPELDFERVYSSDLKKMVKWFVVLKNNNIELKQPEAPEEEIAEETPVAEKKTGGNTGKESKVVKETAVKEAVVEEKPKAKKTASKTADAEKPAAHSKKAAAEKEETPAPKKAAKAPAAEKPAAHAKKAASTKTADDDQKKPKAKKPAAKKKS